MLSDSIATWLVWISLSLGIIMAFIIIYTYETYDYHYHKHDKGMDKVASAFRIIFAITLLFTLFYSLVSLQYNHANQNVDKYVQQAKEKYNIELTIPQMKDLIASYEDGIKIKGKTLIAVNHDDDIMILEYKDNQLKELTKQ